MSVGFLISLKVGITHTYYSQARYQKDSAPLHLLILSATVMPSPGTMASLHLYTVYAIHTIMKSFWKTVWPPVITGSPRKV